MNLIHPTEEQLKLLTAFTGCGGFDCGAHQAGFKTLGAMELNQHAIDSFKLNFPDSPIIKQDINKITGLGVLEEFGLKPFEVDLFAAGPPCQPFSIDGKRDLFDPRSTLYLRTLRMINQIVPKVFLIENVMGLRMGKIKEHFWPLVEMELDHLRDEYEIIIDVLNASHYGTGQDRYRLIVLGVHKSLNVMPSFPEPDLECAKHLRICDLIPGIDGIRFGRNGKNFRSCLKLAPTITKTANCWPVRNGEIGEFTVAEVLKLCGFPDDWKTTGSINQIRERAGNAIMPPFAKALCEHIRKNLLPPSEQRLIA